MPRKSKFHCSVHEVGESSRSFRSRRLPAPMNCVPRATMSIYSYFDDGDCDYVCEHCGALFWFAERIVYGPLHARPQYTHCCKGVVVRLPFPLYPPAAMRSFFEDAAFMENIRAYNNMFSMTSFGARIDEAVNDGRGPYVFKVSGQVSHWIGSICPPPNEGPRFLQLYIYDTDNEVPNRLRFFGNSGHTPLSPDIVRVLGDTLKSCNEYVRLFRSAADMCDASAECNFSVILYNNVGDRRYEPPASGTLGGIVFGDDSNASNYDIIVHRKDGPPHRVSKLHPSYIPLQYPLLFPFAEPGWSPDMRLHSISGARMRNLTVNMYYSFHIQDRENTYSLLLNGGRLFQQYLVDAYTCIEQSRLDFVNANQNTFRSELVAGLYDALGRGDSNAHDIGKRVLLPSSFTGGPRYMYKHYQDALAICRVYGNPQYFITFTCNVKWPEISRHLVKIGGGSSQNRPDIIARVFRIKVQQFLRFMKSEKTFGDIVAASCFAIHKVYVSLFICVTCGTTTQMVSQRVRDIRERQKSGTIEIRVIKKWISKGKKEELCYQFVDAYGDCIEATTDVKEIEHFDSIIQLQSCYKVTGYICIAQRTYMATVNHPASLVIGHKAKFDRTTNDEIPTMYFNFATYDMIKQRVKNTQLLTDYIGRVEKSSLCPTRTGMMKREVEITLWPDMSHLIGDNVIPGHIVAITSAIVTEHNGLLQLESTYLTTLMINPDMPQTDEHVQRLKALPAMQPTVMNAPVVTILDLKKSSQQTIQASRNFTSEARIAHIHDNRGWYYVLCSKCSKKLYAEEDNGDVIFVCKDDDDIVPNFRYCVNATITDATGSADAVFFNESMEAILNISCEDMVTKHGQTTNPRNVPQLLKSIVNIPKELHLTQKNDGQIVVNNVTEVRATSDIQSPAKATGTSTFSPTTPITKPATSKRQLQETPGPNKKQKRT
ncbi:hypothetical protein CASFOL_018543 [Castilleja foliolosa]|uniref:Helitron helicase-like domain-containing protein n=1 Tax=Castilleja foliolosa TaxID=1961234 RepID=A0ABD3D8Z5_9LAMI